jgi:hypothetical protein
MTHINDKVRQIVTWLNGQLDELFDLGFDLDDLDIDNSEVAANLVFGRD